MANEHSFKGALAFLSNMYKCPITMSLDYVSTEKKDKFLFGFKEDLNFDNNTYPSSENLYQALKYKYPSGRHDFRFINPFESKQRGKKIAGWEIRTKWLTERLLAMELVIDIKFNQNKNLAQKLINTPDELLVEWNTWGDKFWGICLRTNKGENNLGKLLLKKKYEILERLERGWRE